MKLNEKEQTEKSRQLSSNDIEDTLTEAQLDILADQFNITLHSRIENFTNSISDVNIIAYSSTTIDFQIFFDHLEMISLDPLNPDFITFKIDANLLKDPITGEQIDTSDVLTQELPTQMDPEFAEEFTAGV